MARKPDTPCAQCGKLLYSGKGCLPGGRRTCQPCRRTRRAMAAETTPIVLHPCAVCGVETVRPAYCSASCSNVSKLRRRVAKETGARPRCCEMCTATYRPSHPGQRTCGRACGVALRRRTPRVRCCRDCNATFELHTASRGGDRCAACRRNRQVRLRSSPNHHPCGVCGKPVVGRKYCVQECARMAQRRRDLVRYGTSPEAVDTCARCHGEKPVGQRRYCMPCSRVKARECIRTGRRRRRARLRGVTSEPYTLAEIAQRDRYMCGLCRKRVAMKQAVPHPKAPTIDHVVPLAELGDDVRANVQLAHFICNSRKSDRGMQQLALIG